MSQQVTLQQAIELAIAHERGGRLAEAEDVYRQVLQQHPDEPAALHLLGCLAFRAGNLPAAEQFIRRSTQVAPELAQRHSDLGVVLLSMGRHEEATEVFREALRRDPDLADALSNLAALLADAGRLAEALVLARRAVELHPGHADAWHNIGHALTRQGKIGDALSAYRRAMELKPDAAQAHSDLLLALHYLPDFDPAAMLDEHRRYARRFQASSAQSATPPRHRNRRDPDRRLRIGYVSRDFRQHSVGHFIEAALEKHGRNSFEVFCYSDVDKADAMTRRMQAKANVWRQITGAPDAAVEGAIRQDQVDILVDLAGHAGQNRLPVFARKPAPVQVSYLGYPDTTGLSAIDYRLTDSQADPAGAESLSVERLIRIDPCAWCFRPHEPYPDLRPPTNPDVTFGTFNAVPKLNEPLIATWSEILRQVPGSRFVMKAAALVDQATADRLRGQFVSHGVAADRIELLGQRVDATQHLAMYEKLDVALDTFPYNGTTTTCEAMWMGVPVVTLAGRAHAGRVGVSLLENVRLRELIAPDRDGYVWIAVELARDRDRLSALRASLRRRMLASPLMNGVDFVRRLESAYRTMWRNYCNSGRVSV